MRYINAIIRILINNVNQLTLFEGISVNQLILIAD